MTALTLSSRRVRSAGDFSHHLLEVEGYLGGAADQERLGAFARALDEKEGTVLCVGGYPVPVAYSRTVPVVAMSGKGRGAAKKSAAQ